MKSGNLNFLEPSGPHQACNGNDLPIYNHLSHSSFKIVPCTIYKFLAASVKVLEIFQEPILRKTFQLFSRILNDVSRITKTESLQCWLQSREQVKISWSQVRRIWGTLERCKLPWPKPIGALEHCREVETICWFSIFRGVALWLHPEGDEGFRCIFPLFGVVIPVNYTR